MPKQTVTQRSFVIGTPREEFLEADDLDLRLASLRAAENIRIKATRTVDQKLGSWFRTTMVGNLPLFEIRPTSEETYAVMIETEALTVWDEAATAIYVNTDFNYGVAQNVWVEGFGKDIIIGCDTGLYSLTYTSSSEWAVTEFSFAEAPGGELAQPYWSFVQGITILPSALTGSITLTASSDVFNSNYVGLRVRYAYREVEITAYTSATQVTGTVVSSLPPTYRLTVTSSSAFRVGDAIVGQDTGYEGVVVAVAVGQIDVVTLRFMDGPDVGENVSSPSGSSAVTGKSSITPAATTVWDEPLISPVRGYPRSATGGTGRLILADFPQAQDVICASSVREVFDFAVGDEDDDAIVRAVGDNRPRFRHVVNVGDLLLLADRGVYMVELRNNTPLSPASFVPRLVDRRGASSVKPAQVDDGVIFVEASGEALAVATLDGNIYLKWSVRTISTFHSHLIASPVALCGPPENSILPEKYLFVVNADGSLAVMSWVDGFDAENVGFVPWTTDGDYKAVYPVFGQYWAVVNRTVAGVSRYLVEELASDAWVDCALPVASIDPIFIGQDLSVCGSNWYAGEVEVLAGPTIEGTYPADAQVGWNYESRAMLWPQKQVNHPKAGILAARVIRVGFSVLHTGPFAVRCNNITQRFGGYSFGDDLSEPSEPDTKLYRCSVIGRRDHPEIEIIKETPGLFQVLMASQEVTF